VGDKGFSFANEIIQIIDTKKENNLILHFTKKFENVTVFVAKVDSNQDQILQNHLRRLDASIEKHIGNT
jgi:alanyl-tRNA synthetase